MRRSRETTRRMNAPMDAGRRLWSTWGFWVIFMAIVPASGQIQGSRTDVLKGNFGEDSCTLKLSAEGKCPALPATPNGNPTPSDCTCNNLYFNIWSSCLLSQGQATLPTFSNWTSSCTTFGVPMQNNNVVRLEGIVPKWAFLQIPADTTFDVQAAVLVANPSSRWSPLQVALPWCSALLTLITTLAFVKFWRRSRPNSAHSASFSQRFKYGLSGFKFWAHRVRPVDTQKMDGEWTIDSPSEGAGSVKSGPVRARRKETYETYVFVDRMSPIERSPISPIDTIPAHPSIPSSASQDRSSMVTDSGIVGANGRRVSETLRERWSIGAGAAAIGVVDDKPSDAPVLELDLTQGDTQSERPPGGLVHVPGMDFSARRGQFISSPHRSNGAPSSSGPRDLSTTYAFSSPTSGFGSPSSRTDSPASAILGSIRNIGGRMPWKRRQHHVTSMKPTRKFRIDLDVESSKASSAAGSGASEVGGGGGSDVLLNEHDDPELALHRARGGAGESSVGYGDADEDEERETLITDSERRQSSVLMIGNPIRSVGSSSKSAYSQQTGTYSTVNSNIDIVSATTGPESPTRSVNPTSPSMLSLPPVPAFPIVLPPPPSTQPPPAPILGSRAHLRGPPSTFQSGRPTPDNLTRSSPNTPSSYFSDFDPRGLTSNLHIQTESLSKPSTSSFSLQDLGASNSPLAPPPFNRFHAMTPIQEDARSHMGRSSPTPSSITTHRPASPALSYAASTSLPRSSSPSPALSYSSIPPHPRRNQSNDSSHSISILSPSSNSGSEHSRSGSITTPTTPLNVGMRRKNSNDSNAMLSPTSNLGSPISAAPSSNSSNQGIMQIISMSPRPRTPDSLLVTLSNSELVRTGSNQSQRSIRPLPSPGMQQIGGQHKKSLSQNDISSTPQPSRTHTPTLSGSGVIGTGSPLSQSLSYSQSHPGIHHVPDDRFDAILAPGEFSRTTGGHRRGLVPDDRTSFYMTPDPLLSPVATRTFSPQRRNFTSENGSGNEGGVDPVSLVPASVRGAGYRI